jgi:hypothetical protein
VREQTGATCAAGFEMRWKELIIGSVLTLAVTIVGGLAVYAFTREQPRAERLVYEVPESLTFDLPSTKRSFVTIRAGNLGTAAANGVKVFISPPSPILDKSVAVSSGPSATFEDTSTKTDVELQLASLLPGETVTVTLMLEGVDTTRPSVVIRSSASQGQAGSLIAETRQPYKRFTDKALSAVGVALIAQLAFAALVFAGRKRLLNFFPAGHSHNNAAFVWLHNGLADDAASLLRAAIYRSGASPHELSNYGFTVALRGRADEGRKHVMCARWWARTAHEQAVAEFNLALIDFLEGETASGIDHLRKAFSMSRREIRRYCGFSVHIADARQKHKAVEQFLSELHL